MSSLLKSSSPASGAPDLLPAQDIEQLIDNALAIKEDIGIVKNTLSRLESSEQLEAVAGDCKKKFDDFLISSRSSASSLHGRLRDFVSVIVPMAGKTKYGLAARIDAVRSSTIEMVKAADKESRATDPGFKEVQRSLKNLEKSLRDYSGMIETHVKERLDQVSRQIAVLEGKIETSDGSTGLDAVTGLFGLGRSRTTPADAPKSQPKDVADEENPGKPATNILDQVKKPVPPGLGKQVEFAKNAVSIVTKLSEFFNKKEQTRRTAASLEEKKNELAKLKEDITKEKTKVEMILDGLTDVSERFAGLDGKLGNFEAIWTKLIHDVKALDAYLNSPAAEQLDEEAFKNRIAEEETAYKHIMLALDNYAIKVASP